MVWGSSEAHTHIRVITPPYWGYATHRESSMALSTPRTRSHPLANRERAVRPPTRTTAVLALTGANPLRGGSAAASKAALPHLPPVTLATLRVALALTVLRLLLARTGDRPATGIVPALLGLTGVTLFCVCQNVGLGVADAATTSLLKVQSRY